MAGDAGSGAAAVQRVGNTCIPEGDAWFARVFAKGDVFELPVLLAGLAHVRRWRTAVDGGAHVGSWTRYLAGAFGRVIAFEPQDDNWECLEANTLALANVERHHCALGAAEGRVGLDPGTNTGCWHVAPGDSVPVVPLDALGLGDLDYLKLDVEGYEGHALQGARQTIARCRPVIQIEEKSLPHAYDAPSARSRLEQWGYLEVARAGRDVVFACSGT